MRNFKIFYWVSIILVAFLGLNSCHTEYTDEDYLVGDPWHLTKTVHYVQERSHWTEDFTEYEDDDVAYKFYRNGDLRIRTTRVTHFNRIYADWIDGSWRLRGDDLVLRTRDGVWNYQIGELTDWRMVLIYYQDVYDDNDRFLYEERVEEFYNR